MTTMQRAGWAGLTRQERADRTAAATAAHQRNAKARARARFLAALDPEGKLRPADRERCLTALMAVWAANQPAARRTG